MGRTGIKSLPADLLRSLYKTGLEHGNLSLKDRVRALAVCRAWREVLSLGVMPIATLELGWENMCQWLITAQPAVEQVSVWEVYEDKEGFTGLLPLALHALPRKAVRALEWESAHSAARALPCLAAWWRLEKLSLARLPFEPDWLQQFSCLRRLGDLLLDLEEPEGELGGQTLLLFPAMPSLTRLYIGAPEGVHLQLQLPSLPLLRKLEAYGVGGIELESSSGAPASRLHEASLSAMEAAVDFAQLPALASLVLAPTRLRGAATIAAATSLTYLCLGDEAEEGHETLRHEWVSEVLRCAPRSLRVLGVHCSWSAEAVALAGGMTHLSGLYKTSWDSFSCLPPSSARLWGQLRALSWGAEEFPVLLSEALRAATRLEVLQVFLDGQDFSEKDLRLLASLPALRKLILVCPDWWCGKPQDRLERAILLEARKAMPNLQMLAGREAAKHVSRDFFDWALGQ